MTSAEIHVVLHLIEVPTSLIRKNILKYQEMYQFFSELLPQWLMHEFHNSNAQTDQEETYAFFVPHQLGLPAYVVLSMIVPEGTHIHDIQQQIKTELDETFQPYGAPYEMSIQLAAHTVFFS